MTFDAELDNLIKTVFDMKFDSKSTQTYMESLRLPNTVSARALMREQELQEKKQTNMPSIQRSFNFINTLSFYVLFLQNCIQYFNSFSTYFIRYVRKYIDAKNPAILIFFFEGEKIQKYAYFSRTTR